MVKLVIVDPYISSSCLINTLLNKGIELIALFSPLTHIDEEERKNRTPPLEKFICYFDINQDNFETIINKLKQIDIQAVIAGFDESLPLADKIAAIIAPNFSNPLSSFLARCSKYEMQIALEKAGLPAVHQIKINHPLNESMIHQLKEWHFPVFVKPTHSVGSVGSKCCHTVMELEQFVNQSFLTKQNQKNYALVLQEFLTGEEYFIDTVSYKGQHLLVSNFKYYKEKHNGYPICRYADILDNSSTQSKEIANFVYKVLDAVEFQNGMAHTEIFITSNGPRLIEINPRLSGAAGFPNMIAKLVYGINQPEILADILLHTNQFTPSNNRPMKKQGRLIILYSWNNGIMEGFAKGKIENLPSYYTSLVTKPFGSILTLPETLFDSVASVLLLHDDAMQIEDDYQIIKQLEESGLLYQYEQ